jgi:hypothetical protein
MHPENVTDIGEHRKEKFFGFLGAFRGMLCLCVTFILGARVIRHCKYEYANC